MEVELTSLEPVVAAEEQPTTLEPVVEAVEAGLTSSRPVVGEEPPHPPVRRNEDRRQLPPSQKNRICHRTPCKA